MQATQQTTQATPPTRRPARARPIPSAAPSNTESQEQLRAAQEAGEVEGHQPDAAQEGIVFGGWVDDLMDWLFGDEEESGAVCTVGTALEELNTAMVEANELASQVERAAPNNPRVAKLREALDEASARVARATDIASTACEVAELVREMRASRAAWERLQSDPTSVDAQREAADRAGAVFGSLGQLLEATGIPGLSHYGQLLSGFGGDFFFPLATTINRTTSPQFGRDGVQLRQPSHSAVPYRGLTPPPED